MVYVGSKINFVDNSGVRIGRCIKVLGSNPRVVGRVGNILVCAVLRALPGRKIKVHDTCKCVLIKQRKVMQRTNGLYVSCLKNAAVVIEARFKQPVASRIKGSCMLELRRRRHMKIMSMCSSII